MSIKFGIATAAFLASASVSFADQKNDRTHFTNNQETPASVVFDRSNGSDFVSFKPVENLGGGTTTHEARVDFSMGVLCEWDVVSRYSPAHKKNIEKIKNIDCIDDGENIPEWFSAYWEIQPQLTYLIPEKPKSINRDEENLNVGYEVSSGNSYSKQNYTTSNTWNFDKNEVCISIGRSFDEASGVLDVDLGCHPIRNEERKNDIMEYLDIQVPTAL